MQKTEGFVAEKMKIIMRAAIRDLPRGLLSTTKCYNTDCTFFQVGTKSLGESSCNVILQKEELGAV